jgi:hypothetical protein
MLVRPERLCVALCAAWLAGCAPAPRGAGGGPGDLRLDYGPILGQVDARSAHVSFHAARADGTEVPWTAGLAIGASPDLDPSSLLPVEAVGVGAATAFVAHLRVEGLEPGTRYTYVPLVNGARALDGRSAPLPSFETPPDLGGRDADFTVVFLADQHAADGPEAVPMEAYAVAAAQRPLFWAQLGDVAAGHVREDAPEIRRTPADHAALWRRNYGNPALPQARLARLFPLGLATISDHEIADNFSMNWHRTAPGRGRATLHERVAIYDGAIGSWWNWFGWGARLDDALGRAALADRGESVMAETPAALLGDATDARLCVAADRALGFAAGDFVFLADDEAGDFRTRVAEVGAVGGCGAGRGAPVTLAGPPPRPYRVSSGARLAVGARYGRHGHYRSVRPFPFVEFLLLDTTSYRGDPYQERACAVDANRDTDHARYPWTPETPGFIHGDREGGANRTTDGVRSWLGPAQKRAFLEAVAASRAGVVVVVAGYPLYSTKFERSPRYWPGRESGFDFATEVEEIVAALERLDRLVLWVHGDGHTPMLVRLREDLYQIQVGPTLMRHRASPGHRSRTLASGDRATGDLLGGGELIAGHQPDLNLGDEEDDTFGAHLDQFEGCLRLYFHPGGEALRSIETAGLARGANDRVVEVAASEDPAGGAAARHVVGKVARLEVAGQTRHSVITSYRFEAGRARFELADPIVTAAPEQMRVLLGGRPWVEATWLDARGRPWRDFSSVLRAAPEDR